jgi:hypothetical protein
MKGFVIEIGLIGIIFTVGSIMFVLIPLIFTKIHLVEIVELRYKYDNAQLALLSAMSITSQDSLDGKIKPASEIVAEYIAMPSSRSNIDISFIKDALDKMVAFNIMQCYKLSSASAGELAKNTGGCEPGDNTAQMVLPIPYNGQIFTDSITLVMN